MNPRLSLAHKFYANLEADTGRSVEAMVRLLTEATRHGNDAELFAGLVHACRYAGLFDESIAAHAEARRLDPTITTSLLQTLLMNRDLDRLLNVEPADRVPGGGDEGIRVIALGFAGRLDEAKAELAKMGQAAPNQPFEKWKAHLSAWLDRWPAAILTTLDSFPKLKIFEDPEPIFQEGWFFCDVGEYARGLPYLQDAIAADTTPRSRWPSFRNSMRCATTRRFKSWWRTRKPDGSARRTRSDRPAASVSSRGERRGQAR